VGTREPHHVAIGDRKPLRLRSLPANQDRDPVDEVVMDSSIAELTAVQRVSLLTLRLRALDARSDTPILGDALSVQVAERLGLDLTSKISRSMVLVHAVRDRMLDRLVSRFVADHPTAVVVDLGCGLDTRRHRCNPPPGVDWYDVDFPAVIGLRERLLPDGAHLIGADVTATAWLDELPRERPAIVVTNGLMLLLTAEAFIALTRAVTAHFDSGELAFNAYSRLALRNSRRAGRRKSGPWSMPAAVGDGIDDPHEAEAWDAGLSLIEEQFMANAPEVNLWPTVWKTVARLNARSIRFARAADRVIHYRFARG
jgi:O-methyltransferase involved in polyketide biosynthesis